MKTVYKYPVRFNAGDELTIMLPIVLEPAAFGSTRAQFRAGTLVFHLFERVAVPQ